MATRMRKSLADLEHAFVEEIELDRSRRNSLLHTTAKRARRREVERVHKHGFIRFVLLALTLLVTAVLVTVLMFRVLYIALG